MKMATGCVNGFADQQRADCLDGLAGDNVIAGKFGKAA